MLEQGVPRSLQRVGRGAGHEGVGPGARLPQHPSWTTEAGARGFPAGRARGGDVLTHEHLKLLLRLLYFVNTPNS